MRHPKPPEENPKGEQKEEQRPTIATKPPPVVGPVTLRNDLETIHDSDPRLTFIKNVSIPSSTSKWPIRANVYIPKDEHEKNFPVLVTYGPYGKDIHYSSFHPESWRELNHEHKSEYSAWETPDPAYWCGQGYVVVRADERGTGQSPGLLDTMSKDTTDEFCGLIEWCARQSWSSGKVGLLGVSYYAGSQWRVAARRPKGLAAIIPWEGMSDYYRDRCRHGGILSNKFIDVWWNRQVLANQYGLPGREALEFPPGGPGARSNEPTLEGTFSQEQLEGNRRDQSADNRKHRFRDEEYYASKDYRLEDIEVPVLSVANWGGITLHLRGNVLGYMYAGSKFKYLRFITGRHDLPFYYKEQVEMQKSFLDAFLKGEDREGWSVPGRVAPVEITLRKGNVGYNNTEKEKVYEQREEVSWPLPSTKYTRFYLRPDYSLREKPDTTTNSVPVYMISGQTPNTTERNQIEYKALGSLDKRELVYFLTEPFEKETEITGHIVAHLNVSVTPENPDNEEPDIDLFVTVRHIDPSGNQVFYTGTAGDPVPVCKGWLRVSNRKVHEENPKHEPWLPYREYFSTDVLPVKPGKVYAVDVELWPTNVVVEKDGRLMFEVSSGDTQGAGIFQHTSTTDRPVDKFAGKNHIHFGEAFENYVTLPIIPGPNSEPDLSVEIERWARSSRWAPVSYLERTGVWQA